VDRAVDYAYQTRRRFPDKAVYLTGEIIHNPHVNDQLRAMDVGFLSDTPDAVDRLTPEDVVILPAFGVTMATLKQLEGLGCTLIDTTCGSVLNVWKNVVRYAREGFTSIIHGKVKHEETRATARDACRDRALPPGRLAGTHRRRSAAGRRRRHVPVRSRDGPQRTSQPGAHAPRCADAAGPGRQQSIPVSCRRSFSGKDST